MIGEKIMNENLNEHLMVRRILIGFDGSEHAKRALRLGFEIARLYEAHVTIVSVVQLPEPAGMVETTAMLESGTEHFQQAFEDLQSSVDLTGVQFERGIRAGHVAEQIVHLAAESNADLIIMGHRGKSLIQEWLLGSVSKRVISYAPCSVLIVR
jgi:nucleotide-binding universal stress UspA family protein